ncbi:MAG TPA: Hsp20/alpha crystallin family protein [Candidatus Paceibacterota bacterium]
MNSEDEKFFEGLSGAGANTEAEGEYAVELVKASGSTLSASPATARPKMIRTKDEKEDLWADGEPEGQLTVDVYQTANDIVVESAIAGVDPDDIDVNVTTDSISIRGSRKREKNVRDEDYLYQECYWGKFGRSIILPQEVDPESAAVKFKNGILTVTLPKANKKKTRKLKVRLD